LVALAAAGIGVAAVAAPAAADGHHGARRGEDRPVMVRSGTGNATTPTFTVPAGWELGYSYRCGSVPGHVGNFIVVALRTPGDGALTILWDRPVRTLGSSGHGMRTYRDGGSGVFLEVNTDCSWTVVALR
jgi:hypothetical protein